MAGEPPPQPNSNQDSQPDFRAIVAGVKKKSAQPGQDVSAANPLIGDILHKREAKKGREDRGRSSGAENDEGAEDDESDEEEDEIESGGRRRGRRRRRRRGGQEQTQAAQEKDDMDVLKAGFDRLQEAVASVQGLTPEKVGEAKIVIAMERAAEQALRDVKDNEDAGCEEILEKLAEHFFNNWPVFEKMRQEDPSRAKELAQHLISILKESDQEKRKEKIKELTTAYQEAGLPRELHEALPRVLEKLSERLHSRQGAVSKEEQEKLAEELNASKGDWKKWLGVGVTIGSVGLFGAVIVLLLEIELVKYLTGQPSRIFSKGKR